jgi:hypothetical protein
MRVRLVWIAIVLPIFTVLALRADEPFAYTLDDLARRPWCELEAIYRRAGPGSAPNGFLRGHVVYRPDDFLAGPREKFANFTWLGKHFSDGALINQFRGLRFIRANVALGESWLDGRPAHVLDYQNTSHIWKDVRDEAREVSPGVYIGAMYLRRCPEPRLKVLFILEADCCQSPK